MKKLITTDITADLGAPLTAPALDNLQDNFKEIPDAIVQSFIDSYTTNDLIILYGVVITVVSNTATWTKGAIYYNGEVYQVAAGTATKGGGDVFIYSLVDSITNETFDDGTSHPWIEVKTITIGFGASGSGIADYLASSVKRKIKRKIIAIGDWNMNSSSSINVAHGLATGIFLSIKSVKVQIIPDDSSAMYEFSSRVSGGLATFDGINNTDNINVQLTRKTGGDFDSALYNATSFNRGFITIDYGDI